MQLFINNWSAALTASATASAVSLSVDAAQAALLVGLGSGDHYVLTLAEISATGEELRREIVRCTAAAGGSLTVTRAQEGTTAQVWDVGTVIEARLTKETMETLQASGAVTPSDAAPLPLGAAPAPGTSGELSRADHVHQRPAPADIGAATAAQGAKADTAIQASEKGAASGVATLGSDSKIPLAQLPATAITSTFVVNTEAAMLALSAQEGDVAVRPDISTSFILKVEPASTLANWQELLSPAAGGGAPVGSDTPQPLGTATPGVSASSSRQDHVHAMPGAADIGAAPAGHVGAGGTAHASAVADGAAGFMTGADKAKLDGVAPGATANGSDATLLARANHTGTQATSTITGLDAALAAKMANPMTTAGDLIIGGSAGAPTRLPLASTDGYVLTRVAGAVAWAAATGGMTNPMTGVGDLIIGGAIGAPARLAPGTNGYVLTLVSGLPAWQPAGGGGLPDLVEAKNSASPNATVPIVSLAVSITQTNGGFALVPKGGGPLLASVPDSAVSGGNVRGDYAVDWQRDRSSQTKVASGLWSTLSGGRNNMASGQDTVIGGGNGNNATNTCVTIAGGLNNSASGTNAVIGGGTGNTAAGGNAGVLGGGSNNASASSSAILGGGNNVADGYYSTVLGGRYGHARGVYGVEVRASGRFAAAGDAQRGRHILRIQTTNATATEVTSNASPAAADNQPALPDGSAYVVLGRVVARNAANGDAAAWEFKGLIKRGSGAASTALVGSITPASIAADSGAASWSVAVVADTTNGCLSVKVTGVASTAINWVADVETVEVVG